MNLLFWSYIPSLLFISLGQDLNIDLKPNPKWNYEYGTDYGPDKWSVNYEVCSGQAQSPIDLRNVSLKYDPNLAYFNFSDYKLTSGVTWEFSNTGSTVQVAATGKTITLRGGGLPAEYNLVQLHFHWGITSDVGSEHLIEGKYFPMELHLVHQNLSLNNQDTTHPLAVVGFLFEISPENNTKYDQLLKYFSTVQYFGQSASSIEFPLTDLLPGDLENMDFYRYNGSLTTPPCSQTVIWSVAMRRIKISEAQMLEIRSIHDSDNNTIGNSFRKVQSINKRTILVTTNVVTSTNGGHRKTQYTHMAMLMLLLFVNLF